MKADVMLWSLRTAILIAASLMLLATPQAFAQISKQHLSRSSIWLSSPDALRQAKSQLEREKPDEAVAIMERFLEDQTVPARHQYTALNILCVARARTSDYIAAEMACTEAITLRPNNWDAHNNLAAVYWMAGEYHQARRAYHKALELNPGSGVIKDNLRRLDRIVSDGP